MAITYDGPISIAVGSSRKSTSWQNKDLLWSELASRLSIPTRTTESQAEYAAMPKAQHDEVKDVGGFVGGSLKGGRRKAEAVTRRRLLTLDMDSIPPGADPWTTVTLVIGCAAVLYSTHSHTAEKPRFRLVIPLNRDVTPDEYTAIARRIADDIGIDMCDDTTYEPHRLMYWPSASYDADYVYEVQDGPWLDADEQLKRYVDWHDQSEWPRSSRQSEIMQRLAKRQGDPRTKPGIVGAFCRVYPIEDCIEQFLPDTYIPCSDGRYTYAGGSTSGGLVLYEDGRFAFSHHSTDPASGKLCNSFDLVRLHLYGDLDDEVRPGTPVNRLPSFQALSELAIQDETVRQDLAEAKLADVVAAFDDIDDESADFSWLSELTIDSKGNFQETIKNYCTILKNDPNLKDHFYYDQFQERPVVCLDLPWIKLAQRNSAGWIDTDDAGLHEYIETKYKMDYPSKLREAVDLTMLECQRHPVKEYLESLIWDGVPRADRVFVEYLGAEDSAYTREATRRALIGAVARIFQPGCKHDHMLVLVGPQGCRKSTTLAKLGKSWFSDSLYTVQGKEAYEQLTGYWIIEMGEMAATRKAELEQIKQFLSKQTDSYRSAYARRTQDHPRKCCFFGTTNDEEFLRDTTGGRRFWPVQVDDTGFSKGDTLTEATVDQIWAEIVVRYRAGEQWYLTGAIEKEAREIQAKHTEYNAKQGLIEDFLETKVPADWGDYTLEQRLMFYAEGFGESENPTLVKRDKVCVLEVWVELFKGDIRTMTQAQGREISNIIRTIPGWTSTSSLRFGKLYGRQRGFKRETGASAVP